MQAIADHAYHILIITLVATTIVQAVVKIIRKPRKEKRGPVAPRESAADREKRMREYYAAFGERWREWLDQPRRRDDADRLVTAVSIWGSPEQRASFPRRFHASQLGKVTVDKRKYLVVLDTPVDAVQPRCELAPTSWATTRLGVWALHSRAAQKPCLMRVWLTKDHALVELHRTRVVKVDEILPSEVVGFVRGSTRLGPHTGKMDGLHWLPAETMELGAKLLWSTFCAICGIFCVAPEGSAVADALNAVDFHAFTFVAFRAESAWKEPCAHLRVLDCSGVTYQVGGAFSQESSGERRVPPGDDVASSMGADSGEGARASRRGRSRPSRRRSLRRRRSVAEEAVASASDDQKAGKPQSVESPDREPEPLANTGLAVMPIDPREMLWTAEKMVEL